jgi:hypothetical protein
MIRTLSVALKPRRSASGRLDAGAPGEEFAGFCATSEPGHRASNISTIIFFIEVLQTGAVVGDRWSVAGWTVEHFILIY